MLYSAVLYQILFFFTAYSCYKIGKTAKNCAITTLKTNYTVDEILGKWHVSLILFDERFDYEDETLCLDINLERIDATTLRQIWYIGSDGATIHLPTKIDQSGIWSVISPLGAPINVIVVDGDPKEYLILTFCGIKMQKYIHLWTTVVTRKKDYSPFNNLVYTSLVASYGFNVDINHMIHLKYC